MPSWLGAELKEKHRENFTFTLPYQCVLQNNMMTVKSLFVNVIMETD
jgi:hypothetical protein